MEKYNLVPRAKKAIEAAIDYAAQKKHSKVNSAHILCGLIDNATIQIRSLFEFFKIDSENLKKSLLIEFKNQNQSFFTKQPSEESLSDDFNETINNAFLFSEKIHQHFIGIEHIFYVILSKNKEIKKFLISKSVPVEELTEAILSIINGSDEEEPNSQKDNIDIKKDSFISKYCENLNESVHRIESKIEGRDTELEKLIEILSCKVKNNCILIGDAGVGKTAIVEALAQRINSYECPIFFIGYKIYSLDLGLMVAGTKYRGQFEERFKGLLEELKKDSHSVLFIDEIHSIVGAGSNEGSLDLANMIKPALARGEIKCIGATTSAEYKKYFEKDSALNRRFQTILVQEPNENQTFDILKKAKVNYEKFHGISYDDLTLKHVISLSKKYMPYRRFPDKAFDVLDRIGAKAKIEKFIVPENISSLEKQLFKTVEESETQLEKKEECQQLLETFLEERQKWLNETSDKVHAVNDDHIIDTVSKISGLDKKKIEINTCKSFLNLKLEMESKIYDQSEVIEKIYNILLCSKAGVRKNKKTLANLLFVGSTGVGKTYTAKVIAEKFFETPNSFLHIDMAEFIEKNSISKILGTSAGYIGYEEGGLLSEFVRNNPNSLVLFDEVEKAHPDVINILLKIMDEGYIIDNFNRKIDFSNVIIVLTGNIGAEFETSKSIGFIENKTEKNRDSEYMSSIKKQLKPELISRLDEVLIFNSKFSKGGIDKIISSTIKEIQETLTEKNIQLNLNEEIKELLYNLVKEDGNNARSVQKILKSKFELPLCEFIVSNENILEISQKIVDNKIVFV
jgi:ATP-dependent Clp protease ATP-binding subunit ClpC